MKITKPLQHGKYFWWGKGWGKKPPKNNDAYLYRRQLEIKRKRSLEVVEQTLPEGAVPLDPNKYLKEDFQNKNIDFILPWPYSKRPIKGILFGIYLEFVY